MSGHRVLPHPADVALEAWGPDLAAALDQAVAALAAIETSGGPPPATGTREVDVDATTPEALLVALLEECLFQIDAHGWLAVGASVDVATGRAVLRGAEWDGGDDGVHVKAVTWHDLAVVVADDVRVHVLLDL